MSQRERILHWLETRGDEGVHSFELVEAHMPRGAAVICQLRKDGYAIESERQPYHGEAKGVRYFLRPTELLTEMQQPDERHLVAAPGGSAYDPYSEWA